MSKRKKLNRLTGLVPTRNYENYNPLLETDNRVGRRFGVGLLASAFVNVAILGGAGIFASKLPIAKSEESAPIDIFIVPKEEPAPVQTPPPPQVAIATPPPPVEVRQPEPERQREPDRILPKPEPRQTPPPERVRATPPPVQVAKAERPKPIIPTPEPVVATPPPPEKLEEQKPTEVAVKSENSQQAKREETSVARRVAEMPKPTTQALAAKSEMGSTAAVVAPTRNRNPRELVGATTTVPSRSKTLAELREEASNAGGGNPVTVSAAAAGAPGSGPALNARAVSATSASNDQSQVSLNTASAGNASVLDSTPTRSIRGPVASTGALSARSRTLTALGPSDQDDNSFSFVQGGTVTAGKVVGTQGATARGTVITSASGVAQPQFAGADNGIKVSTPGGVPIRRPRIAAGNPGLSGPRTRAVGQVALGDAGGQIGAPGNFNSSLPGGGGVSGSGTGGSGGAGGPGGAGSGSLRARGGSIGTGGGTGGGALRAQSSGAEAVASSRIGRPTNGRLAANGSTTTGPRGRALSTTSVGDLDGPSGGAGDVDGTPGGQGRAGRSSGRSGSVDGAATGGSLGAKTGTGGSDTVASSGDGNGNREIRTEKADTTGPGSKLQRSANAEATFRPEPEIPDSMRSEKFSTSVSVHASIDSNGRASYELTRSSGSDVIDRLVTRTLSRWKWKAAIRNGVAVSSEQDVSITLRVR